MAKRILIVEDDRVLRETTSAYLEAEGFRVLGAADGLKGLEMALREKLDLILLDLVLPELDGIELVRRLREKGRPTPVIILTGEKKEEIDKVLGLELGADEYMVKPFGQRELLARIHAVLRRGQPSAATVDEVAFGDVKIDFKKLEASKAGAKVELTAREYALLKLLVAHEGEVVTRTTILNEVWGYERFPTTRTVDTFIHNLRRKVEDDPSKPAHILTVHWAGYKFQKRPLRSPR